MIIFRQDEGYDSGTMEKFYRLIGINNEGEQTYVMLKSFDDRYVMPAKAAIEFYFKNNL